VLDVLVKGGEVVDGTGAPRRRADVGIRDGRVVAIGKVDEAARRTIDADGRVVTPGFVDIHTHYDVQGFWDPTLSPSPLHGVTTVFAGNCGFTVAPLVEREADYLMRLLARVEGMPLETLQQGVPWNWRTTAEYFAALDGKLAINAGFSVGHSTVRRVVMGEESTRRTATDDEIAAMSKLVHEGLAAGGIGFSTSRARSHSDANGEPVPSRHAAPEEVVALASICRDHPGTSLEIIAQSEGTFRDDTNDLLLAMSKGAQRPINWNVIFPRASNRDENLQRLEVSDRARALGAKIIGLVMPVRAHPRLSFWGGFALDMLPGWAQPMTAPIPEKIRLLSDPAERRRLADLAAQPSPTSHLGNWADRVILDTFTPETKRYSNRLVGDIAGEEGKDPFDVLCDIALADGLRTTFTLNQDPMDPAEWPARLEMMRDPRTVIGASDAGAHLDQAAQFHFATLLLSVAVRELQLLPLEELVMRITDVPARLYGVRDRGRLAEGACADVVVFDEATVGSEPIATRFDLPAGAGRLCANSIGVEHVLVNGEEIVADGAFTDARPGTVLRSGRDTYTPAMN
jgi:N-acyl-D-aspartate/D-glutamate deacylase